MEDNNIQNPEVEVEEAETEEKTYSQAELDAETSKRVDKALKRKELEQANAIKDAVSKAIKDYEAKAKMSEEERVSQELKDREEAIAKREAEAERREYLADVAKELAVKELPMSFAELIVNSAPREGADELIESVKKEIDALITEAVKGKARQSDPKAASFGFGDSKTSLDLADIAAKHRKVN